MSPTWTTSARWLWTGETLHHNVALTLDANARILHLRPSAAPAPGLLLPGMVNAHAHLELSDLLGRVPGGNGSVPWVEGLIRARGTPDPAAITAAARSARGLGTAALIDTSNSGATLAPMRAAGLHGVIQIETIGLLPERAAASLAAARTHQGDPQIHVRPTAHAPFSCNADLLQAALAPGGPPATIHCAEDPADTQLLAHRSGPWVPFLDRLGGPWRDHLSVGATPVQVLHHLGLLPHIALVHMVHATAEDLDLLAGTTVILCPRSNLHIGGRLPDLRALVARQIPLALGTDSLASCPDLDLLAEAATLSAAAPDLPPETWLRAATSGGARLLPPDTPLGLLRVALPATEDPLRALLDGTRWPRRWEAPEPR